MLVLTTLFPFREDECHFEFCNCFDGMWLSTWFNHLLWIIINMCRLSSCNISKHLLLPRHKAWRFSWLLGQNWREQSQDRSEATIQGLIASLTSVAIVPAKGEHSAFFGSPQYHNSSDISGLCTARHDILIITTCIIAMQCNAVQYNATECNATAQRNT